MYGKKKKTSSVVWVEDKPGDSWGLKGEENDFCLSCCKNMYNLKIYKKGCFILLEACLQMNFFQCTEEESTKCSGFRWSGILLLVQNEIKACGWNERTLQVPAKSVELRGEMLAWGEGGGSCLPRAELEFDGIISPPGGNAIQHAGWTSRGR